MEQGKNKNASHLQMSNLDKQSAEQSAKMFEKYNKVVKIKKEEATNFKKCFTVRFSVSFKHGNSPPHRGPRVAAGSLRRSRGREQ